MNTVNQHPRTISPKETKRSLIHNQVSSYAVALSQITSQTPTKSITNRRRAGLKSLSRVDISFEYSKYLSLFSVFFLLFYKILVVKTLFHQTLQVTEGFFLFLSLNRLSYYNVTTRLVDLVGLCWLKQNLVEKIC